MARYEAGETLASIARTYDCSPPAISYVVSRSRARHADPAPAANPPAAAEPQLIKATTPEEAAAGNAPVPSSNPAAAAEPSGAEAITRLPWPDRAIAVPIVRRDEPLPRETNGFAQAPSAPAAAPRPAIAPAHRASPGAQSNGDQRRTLHLSLGNTPQGNGSAHPAETQPGAARSGQPNEPPATLFDRSRDGAASAGLSDMRAPTDDESARRSNGSGGQRKDAGGSFIDHELRARVEGDITAFLAAFDGALAQDTPESRSALREATDRLLRAGARTRIELERLEARIPLPPRDGDGRHEAWHGAWRQR